MNPIGVIFGRGEAIVRALTYLEIPEAVEVHPLLVDVPGTIKYPVTLWNISNKETVTARLEVLPAAGGASLYSNSIDVQARHGEKMKAEFSVPVRAGEYLFRVHALGKSGEGKVIIK